MALWHPQNPIVRNVQAAFKGISLVSCEKCMEHLGRIIDEELWRVYKNSGGISFDSFPQWVAQSQPHGLGVSSQRRAEFLRKLLVDGGRIGTWALILDYISVKPGRPEKLVDDDGFRPYYHISTASNATDRMLRRLMLERPDLFSLVVDGQLTVRDAAKRAGWVKEPSAWTADVTKLLGGFQQLDGEGQIALLDLLWSRMEPSARQKFMTTRGGADG